MRQHMVRDALHSCSIPVAEKHTNNKNTESVRRAQRSFTHLCCAARTPLKLTSALRALISFHFISFHFISFHFISFHFISFHFISFHFISFHFISFHFISFQVLCNRTMCLIHSSVALLHARNEHAHATRNPTRTLHSRLFSSLCLSALCSPLLLCASALSSCPCSCLA